MHNLSVNRAGQRLTIFWLIVTLIFLIKFLLIGTNEIIALPYDSEQYVRQAISAPWGIGVPIGYPVWLALSRWTGIPQRLMIELFFLFSSVILCVALKRHIGTRFAIVALLALVLSPTSYSMFDYALSDGFYASLSVMALGFSCFLLFSTSRVALIRSSTALGACLGWMAVTRNEDPLLISWVVLLLIFLYIIRRKKTSANQAVKAAGLAAVLIISVAVFLVQCINISHAFYYGIYARNLSSLPSHIEFLNKMASIDEGVPHSRYIPISSAARKLAYDVSPTLKKYESVVENRDNIYQIVSRGTGLLGGEIGAGWVWHVFSNAIFSGMGTGDVKILDDEYRNINHELDLAIASGKLKTRFILHPFVTSPLADIARRLPQSVFSVARRSFESYKQADSGTYERDLFDVALNRRSSLTPLGLTQTIQGWVFVDSPDRYVKQVFLTKEDGKKIEARRNDRLDVVHAYGRDRPWQPHVFGYRERVEGAGNTPIRLSYVLDNGREIFSNSELIENKVSVLGQANGLAILQGIDVFEKSEAVKSGWRQVFQSNAINFSNKKWLSGLLIAVYASLLIILLIVPKLFVTDNVNLLNFLRVISALFLFRVFFYSVIESEAWSVEIRYMLSANFMAVIFIGLALTQLFPVRKFTHLGFQHIKKWS